MHLQAFIYSHTQQSGQEKLPLGNTKTCSLQAAQKSIAQPLYVVFNIYPTIIY